MQLQQEVDKKVVALLPRSAQRKCKDILLHDALWGSISLSGPEVAMLNTPLLQRLRRVRQLGSTHLIFPAAQHTRFEHSLGVVHLTAQMCAALVREFPNQISTQQIANLRMAALCHDLGHGPFSHYSEKFFAKLEPLASLLRTDHHIGAAELLSAMIVRSKRFREQVAELNAAYGCELDPDFIANAITGKLSDQQAYLGEIIHGPFDADKLDYLARDSMFCGMPIRLDTDRIFTQLAIADDDQGRKRLVGKRGGIAALMQIIQHKHHMFATVYNHPVARSFHVMLETALRLAYQKMALVNGSIIYGPADFLALDDELLLAAGTVENNRAAKLLGDLRGRNMYKVAAWITGGNKLKEEQRQKLDKNAKDYANEIAKTAELPEDAVAIDICSRQSNAEACKMLVLQQDGSPIELGDIMPQLNDKAIPPLHNFLEQHLVLCPAKHVDKVAAAAIKVLKPVVKDALDSRYLA